MSDINVRRGGSPGELVAREGDRVLRLYAVATTDRLWIFHDGRVYEILTEADHGRRRTAHAHGTLTAPMPATVVAVNVAPGDAVRRGDVLIVLEAMKMELPVRSPGDGKVTKVHCRPGDLVQPHVGLIELE
jgi:3-methylcrotonyl-CoA carboxylase alpha subunit